MLQKEKTSAPVKLERNDLVRLAYQAQGLSSADAPAMEPKSEGKFTPYSTNYGLNRLGLSWDASVSLPRLASAGLIATQDRVNHCGRGMKWGRPLNPTRNMMSYRVNSELIAALKSGTESAWKSGNIDNVVAATVAVLERFDNKQFDISALAALSQS